jgi:hypothetical protein
VLQCWLHCCAVAVLQLQQCCSALQATPERALCWLQHMQLWVLMEEEEGLGAGLPGP